MAGPGHKMGAIDLSILPATTYDLSARGEEEFFDIRPTEYINPRVKTIDYVTTVPPEQPPNTFPLQIANDRQMNVERNNTWSNGKCNAIQIEQTTLEQYQLFYIKAGVYISQHNFYDLFNGNENILYKDIDYKFVEFENSPTYELVRNMIQLIHPVLLCVPIGLKIVTTRTTPQITQSVITTHFHGDQTLPVNVNVCPLQMYAVCDLYTENAKLPIQCVDISRIGYHGYYTFDDYMYIAPPVKDPTRYTINQWDNFYKIIGYPNKVTKYSEVIVFNQHTNKYRLAIYTGANQLIWEPDEARAHMRISTFKAAEDAKVHALKATKSYTIYKEFVYNTINEARQTVYKYWFGSNYDLSIYKAEFITAIDTLFNDYYNIFQREIQTAGKANPKIQQFPNNKFTELEEKVQSDVLAIFLKNESFVLFKFIPAILHALQNKQELLMVHALMLDIFMLPGFLESILNTACTVALFPFTDTDMVLNQTTNKTLYNICCNTLTDATLKQSTFNKDVLDLWTNHTSKFGTYTTLYYRDFIEKEDEGQKIFNSDAFEIGDYDLSDVGTYYSGLAKQTLIPSWTEFIRTVQVTLGYKYPIRMPILRFNVDQYYIKFADYLEGTYLSHLSGVDWYYAAYDFTPFKLNSQIQDPQKANDELKKSFLSYINEVKTRIQNTKDESVHRFYYQQYVPDFCMQITSLLQQSPHSKASNTSFEAVRDYVHVDNQYKIEYDNFKQLITNDHFYTALNPILLEDDPVNVETNFEQLFGLRMRRAAYLFAVLPPNDSKEIIFTQQIHAITNKLFGSHSIFDADGNVALEHEQVVRKCLMDKLFEYRYGYLGEGYYTDLLSGVYQLCPKCRSRSPPMYTVCNNLPVHKKQFHS